jgi:hypothetical protein
MYITGNPLTGASAAIRFKVTLVRTGFAGVNHHRGSIRQDGEHALPFAGTDMVDIQVAGIPVGVLLSHLNLCINYLGDTEESNP